MGSYLSHLVAKWFHFFGPTRSSSDRSEIGSRNDEEMCDFFWYFNERAKRLTLSCLLGDLEQQLWDIAFTKS